MNNSKYQYLFPFEKVKPEADILIYGAGIVGMEYLKQILITNYCNVVAMIDANANAYSTVVVPVYTPDKIHTLKFDVVVVALRGFGYLDEVKRNLIEQGVKEKNIVFICGREEVSIIVNKSHIEEESYNYAYELGGISIAISLSGGLGDMVIDKKVVAELGKYFPEAKIDLYYAKLGDFIKYLYSDCDNINAIIPDLGIRYNENYMKYDLSINIVSTRYIHVDNLKKEVFEDNYKGALDRIEILQIESQKEDYDMSTSVYMVYQTRLYKKLNAYTSFNYNGAFNLDNKYVSIPIDLAAEKEFNKYDLGKYITINCGSGACKDSTVISKTWPKDYIKEFVRLFKEKYPSVRVVHVAEKGVPLIEGVDESILGEDISVVIHILKNSTLHLDIEGGLTHMASQLGTKCFVLFGPTSVEYFGYEDNINIRAGTCRDCYGLNKNVNMCARGMDKPECMYAITPEMVFSEVDEYLKSINK